MKTKIWMAALALGLSLTAPVQAQGQFPSGTLKLVVPFAAGGGVDQAARLLGRQLQTDLGVSVTMNSHLARKAGWQARHNSDVAPDIKKTDTLTTMNVVYRFK